MKYILIALISALTIVTVHAQDSLSIDLDEDGKKDTISFSKAPNYRVRVHYQLSSENFKKHSTKATFDNTNGFMALHPTDTGFKIASEEALVRGIAEQSLFLKYDPKTKRMRISGILDKRIKCLSFLNIISGKYGSDCLPHEEGMPMSGAITPPKAVYFEDASED